MFGAFWKMSSKMEILLEKMVHSENNNLIIFAMCYYTCVYCLAGLSLQQKWEEYLQQKYKSSKKFRVVLVAHWNV